MVMYLPNFIASHTATCFAIVMKFLGKYMRMYLIVSCAKGTTYISSDGCHSGPIFFWPHFWYGARGATLELRFTRLAVKLYFDHLSSEEDIFYPG